MKIYYWTQIVQVFSCSDFYTVEYGGCLSLSIVPRFVSMSTDSGADSKHSCRAAYR